MTDKELARIRTDLPSIFEKHKMIQDASSVLISLLIEEVTLKNHPARMLIEKRNKINEMG